MAKVTITNPQPFGGNIKAIRQPSRSPRRVILPPVVMRMSEEKIVITDTLTNRTVSIDPHKANFRTESPALYGAYVAAYGEPKGGAQ